LDIVIDIHDFRNADKKFIPKEVAVAINATIIGHWIMMPSCLFSDLPVRARQETNWLSRNHHDIEWFDGGNQSPIFHAIITRQARYIYTRGQEKTRYLRNLLSKNVYNLKGISPLFKMLSDGEASGQRCIYHGLRAKTKFRCALRIVDKLKCWLIVQNSNNSSYDSRVLNEN